MSTYLWQEERGKNFYRIQTDEKSVADKLKRRKDCILTSIGLNCKLWVFVCSYSSPSKARISLKRLTGRPIQKDEVTGGFKS